MGRIDLRTETAPSPPHRGGHPQLGLAGALGVPCLDPATNPVPAVGGRIGDGVSVTDDLHGGWPPGNPRLHEISNRVGA